MRAIGKGLAIALKLIGIQIIEDIAAVCISGLVGWVGLVIPQMARMLVGPDHRVMLPASMLVGASYLLVVDTICRNLTAAEIPVSIVTAIFGAPLFLYLLKKAKESWA